MLQPPGEIIVKVLPQTQREYSRAHVSQCHWFAASVSLYGQKRTLIQEPNCIIRCIGVAYSFNIRGTRLRCWRVASTESSAKKSTMFFNQWMLGRQVLILTSIQAIE